MIRAIFHQVLKEGSTASPTKPKGRPRNDAYTTSSTSCTADSTSHEVTSMNDLINVESCGSMLGDTKLSSGLSPDDFSPEKCASSEKSDLVNRLETYFH